MVQTLKPTLVTFVFAYLASIIVTHISEVSFWYIHGNAILVPALYYLPGVLVCLWAVQYFNVHNFAGVYLAGIIYGIWIEGVLASRIYEGGWFDPWALFFTSISWHAMLSVLLVFYFFRKWMLEKRRVLVVVGSLGYGLMWGLFSPINSWFEDAGQVSLGGVISLERYAVYAFTITTFLAAAMYLIGYVWQRNFSLPKWVWALVALWSVVSFVNILQYGADPIRLLIVTLPFVALLFLYKRYSGGRPNILSVLEGKLSVVDVLPVFLMPLAATGVYSFALTPEPWTFEFASEISADLILFQVAASALLLIYALYDMWRGRYTTAR